MPSGGLVGRLIEQGVLRDAVAKAADGVPSATFVHGEAGIGKTTLVGAVCDELRGRGFLVLEGSCLRFGAASASYLPFTQVLTRWFGQADDSERARVLDGAYELAGIAPVLGAVDAAVDQHRLLPLLGMVIDRIAARTPTVLVIDDLQWADATSQDLLAYLIAGFGPGKQQAVVGTYRDIDTWEGHPLHRWLADVRRMPAVSVLGLDRFDLHDTEAQVAALAGPEHSPSLAWQVHSRSGGNPYLTELLVAQQAADAPATARDTTPAALREVLLATWHQLTPPTRELMQLLAVGGRPLDIEVLERLTDRHGSGADAVLPAVAEAAAEGVVVTRPSGEVWFRHPLVAEVLSNTLPPAVAARIHHEYVEVWQQATDTSESLRAAHLALHHEAAGQPEEALAWSLRAADQAALAHGYAEESNHLQRAVRLWRSLPRSVHRPAQRLGDLLLRAGQSANRAGEVDTALAMVEDALAQVDADVHPLLAARLLREESLLRLLDGIDLDLAVEAHRRSVGLTATHPDSPDHAVALAWLAFAESWAGEITASRDHARQAVRIAARTDSDDARALTLGVWSQSGTAPPDSALRDATEALRLARRGGDSTVLAIVGILCSNCLYGYGRLAEAADTLQAVFREMVAAGAAHEASHVGTAAAMHLVDLGHLPQCRAVLREVLATRSAAMWAAQARLIAAQVEVRSGNLSAATAHTRRADELLPVSAPDSDPSPGVIEVMIATGEVESALDAITAAIRRALEHGDNRYADHLVLWAARAAAAWQQRDGRRGAAHPAARRLAEVEAVRGSEPPPFSAVDAEDLIGPAFGALLVAERGRCLGSGEQVAAWATAAQACQVAGLRWDGAVASHRLGEALLVAGGRRTSAATALRSAHATALDIGAEPVREDVEMLCAQAHVPLAEPLPAATTEPPPRLAGITRREREILAHLVAGRTYAEIAAALVISEKTVSVHVSNLLRKTGTRSRIELATLASGPDAGWS